MAESVYKVLSDVNVNDRIKEKNGLKYLSWSRAWSELLKLYPDAIFHVYEQPFSKDSIGIYSRPWFDDGKTGWVKVGVTVDGIERIETLSIMDFKNKAIPADNITSVDANKSMKRCLAKACALHGLGLYIYENEDLPAASAELMDLKGRVYDLFKKKYKLSENAGNKALELCKEAERKFDPNLPEDAITGNIKIIDDSTILTELEKKLLAIRK